LNKALDLGVTYVDTALSYGNGQSEEWVGKVIATRRKGLWLATKTGKRKGDEAMRAFEESLKRLQTDHVDLLHVHSLTSMEDLAAVEASDGVLKTLYKIRDQKMARFIGVTCHADPVALKAALERHDFDCTQMALNAARAGMGSAQGGGMSMNPMKDSFESLALPVALKKKMGVTAMKIFAQEQLVGKAPVEKLIRYSLSLPVAAAVLGMPKLEFIDENLGVAKNFRPLSKSEAVTIAQDLSVHKAGIDRFFAGHVDA
jgi:aryl-alcohol dehydrogenase-like predicted oxidoreductase